MVRNVVERENQKEESEKVHHCHLLFFMAMGRVVVASFCVCGLGSDDSNQLGVAFLLEN
jgi:hypothetical protein